MRTPSRRRLLAVLLGLTVVALCVDVAGGPGVPQLRSAGGAVLGPLERVLAPGSRQDLTGAQQARDLVLHDQGAEQSMAGHQLQALLGSPDLSGREFVPARVVAVGREGAAGPERVTLDAGSRDGVRPDLSVVGAGGLVGRVVAVSPWTCDVLLIGSADLVVGVQVGSAGTLGAVGSGAQGPHRRAAGELNLTVVERGQVRPGDVVTTMGSAGGSPFPAGIRVGTVMRVDDAPGDLTPTAAVRPAADVTALGVVGILRTGPRSTPRPTVTGGG
ncbi:rod shape-determining protein MreC [Phycicoccus badiiscoriae]|uniref:Cell shape-determining protein MreC n=1 Tax=Pedococcus badiiscoriae TaxID=642776 RepID=A0A852WKA9_9MICO|nr:rod shape-determining protein MreC [Pedococcus badiiscoriae]NYG08051.1 rod shape-determining protein MreC [Pedococcus badiiscoriae]